MVIGLLRGVHRPDPQYLAGSVRKVKCARLGYRTRLSRPYTPDPPPISVGLSRKQPFGNTGPQARKQPWDK
jgi:hypothetical protein